jgi:peptidyl-prolyl cis-trans isomerase SurA
MVFLPRLVFRLSCWRHARRAARALAALACVSAMLCVGQSAHATIVERIVAVIGERPVLWTDLLKRASASRVQIRMQTRDPNVIGVQEQEMYKELLDRMIDDHLEEQQADKARITVTPQEIDRGIANIAAQAQSQQGRPVTVQDVLEEVRRRGLSEQDFRDELRRQILEGKLIELRVRPRVRVTDQVARATYQKWTQELKDQQPIEIRYLPKRIPPQATRAQYQAILSLAQEIVKRERAGEDFCKLVTDYTDDVSTRDKCGSHGPQAAASLPPTLQSALRQIPPGTVSDPLPVQVGQDEVLLIVMPMGATRPPAFEEVKNDMMQRALIDGLEHARKQWLQELRQKVYIDVRL